LQGQRISLHSLFLNETGFVYEGWIFFFFQVAEKLMIMHEECLEGNYSSIQKLREAAPRTRAHQHVKQVIMVWILRLQGLCLEMKISCLLREISPKQIDFILLSHNPYL
jgi:hypothetical protein